MALTIPQQWTGVAGNVDAEVATVPTSGNWLIACVAVRVVDGSAPQITIGDPSRNIWHLLHSETIAAHASNTAAQLQVQVWACPAVLYDGWDLCKVMVAAQQITSIDVGSVVVSVAEVAGMVNGYLTVDSVTVGTATAAGSLSIPVPAPAGGVNTLVMTAAAIDDTTKTITVTGAGYTGLTQVFVAAPDVEMAPAWRAATGATTASWSLAAGTANWSGVAVAIRETGVVPAQPNANWPITRLEVGLGYDMSTPLSAVRYTDQTNRLVDTKGTATVTAPRGIPYTMGTAQSESADLTIRNDDGAYTPRVAGSATAKAPGGATINANPHFEVDTTGWVGAGASIARSTAQVHPDAVASLLITPDGVSASGGATSSPRTPVGTITPGQSYTAMLWAYSPGGSTDVRACIDWYDASNVFLSSSLGSASTVPAGTWTLLSQTLTAPAGASRASVRARHGGTPPAGAIWYVWAVRLFATASASSTILIPDAQAASINRSDFFRLKTSAGVLKELTVFQVVDKTSAAGTTTVTFARADGTGVAAVATASGDLYAGIGVDLFVPYRMTMAWGGKVYPLVSGWLGELPQTWRNPAWGTVGAVGMDALGTLTAGVPTALAGEYLRRNPAAYWPMNDPSGTGSAADVSGNGSPALVQTQSKFGAGAATRADFGASTQGVDTGSASFRASVVGDPGTGWSQTGLAAAEIPKKGNALVGKGDSFPPISGGVTLFGWMLSENQADRTAIVNSTEDPTVVILRNADPGAGAAGSVIALNVGHVNFYASVTRWDTATHTPTTSLATTMQMLGLEFRSWALVFNRTEWRCYATGVEVLSGTCNLAAGFDLISVGGQADQFAAGRGLNALHAHVAMFDRMLTAAEITDLDSAGKRGRLSLETKSGLMSRKINTIGWRGPRVISASDVATSAEGNDGGTIAEYGANTAAEDDGLQFLDSAGQLQWRGHVTGYYQSPRATLGEDTAAGEIPFLPGQRYNFDPTYVYHQVTVNNERLNTWREPIQSTIVAIDTVSRGKYGPRSMSLDTRLLATEDAWGLSRALLARYSRTRLRVGQVVIDPASYPTAWAFCLGVETGDLVIVKRRPMGAPVISQTCRVLKVTPSLGPGTATFTLELEAAPDPVIVLGDAVKGSLADRTIGW